MYFNLFPPQQSYQYSYNQQHPGTFRTNFNTLIGDFFTVPNTIPDVGGGISISAGTRVFIHDVSSSGVTIVAPSKQGANGTYIGQTMNIDDITVSYAASTSVAFLVLFSPISLSLEDRVFSDPKNRMQGSPLLQFETIWFSDGGVFDNIGTEPLILLDGEIKTNKYPALAKHRKEPMKFTLF